jgi:hypothetical protein
MNDMNMNFAVVQRLSLLFDTQSVTQLMPICSKVTHDIKGYSEMKMFMVVPVSLGTVYSLYS